MKESYIEGFPQGYKPSNIQTSLIKDIEKAFSSGYKFVVCSAPTGSGKSFLSKTLGNLSREPSSEFSDLVSSYEIYKRNNYGGYVFSDIVDDEPRFGAFALTITKALQDQYKDLFEDTEILKGRNNYQCTYDEGCAADKAPCLYNKALREQCWAKHTCPYYEARNRAVVSRFSSLNYDMFFALPHHIRQKEYMVCDEASELEDQLVKAFSCQVNFETITKSKIKIPVLPSTNDYSKIGRWVQNMTLNVEAQVEILKEQIQLNKTKIGGVKSVEQTNELVILQGLHSKLKTLISTWYDSEYIVERYDKGINFVPLKVDKLSKNIFDCADKVVLMSATIIDPAAFCKTLGIDKFKYIEADSTFKASNGPIYVNVKTKLNYNNLRSQLPQIAKQIQKICDFHKDEKGVIHTQTNFITNFLKNNIHNDRIIYREQGVSNADILAQHTSDTSPTIIASPSISHGIDLKGDLARFQIIIKAPFLPTTDKRVERLMKDDFNWYINKMLGTFIQACGRGIRSKDDFCVTYVLDAAITDMVFKNKNKIPKYFIDRFM